MDHTKGPWQAGNSIGAGAIVTRQAANGSADLIASLQNSCFRETQAADVRLIAAAPQLFQALDELVGEFDETNTQASLEPGVIGYNDTCGIEMAREALRKALEG